MSFNERLRIWFSPARLFAHNNVTLAGAAIATSSAVTLIGLWILDLMRGGHDRPYSGIILFLVLPAVFVLGLVLIPLGVLLRRRKMRALGQPAPSTERLTLSSPAVRRGLRLVMALTAVNVVLLGTASYRGLEYMDSTQFCGRACHSVMAPEYTAYAYAPHSSVACVECHIGPGAGSFVKAKVSGTRQLLEVTFGTYSRPIPAPVKQLRPASETCEHCHSTKRSRGEKLAVRTRYGDDEKSEPSTTVLMLKVGGQRGAARFGIHGRHVDPEAPIRFVAIDDKRQVIPVVNATRRDGRAVEYVSTETKATPQQLAAGEHRTMDCLDCHNRPSHTFELPDRAVDRAIDLGVVSRELPFVKKQAVELLRTEYPDRASAAHRIVAGFTEFYKTSHPQAYSTRQAAVDAAAREVAAIYARNVFPEMKVGWGTYPNNMGHVDFQGCFRCHDESHKAADGTTISQDCETCHGVLATEEADPKILADLGLKAPPSP